MNMTVLAILVNIACAIFIVYLTYNYDKIFKRYQEIKEKRVRARLNKGDKYIQEINKMTNYEPKNHT